MNARVLITGAGGFLGGRLAERMASEGFEVLGLVRDPSQTQRLVELGANPIVGDLSDYDAVRRALPGVEVAYHLAAARRGSSRRELERTNVDGTRNLVRAALEAGVPRLVHCSTAGVHGVFRGLADETSPYRPDSPYRLTKLRSEEVVRELAEPGGLTFAIARPTSVYGPGNVRWLPLYRDILAGRFRMIGTGSLRHHVSYVDDVVQGLALCGASGGAGGRAYILGSDEVPTLAEIVRTIAAECGAPASRRRRLPAPPFTIISAVLRRFGGESPIGADLAQRLELFTSDQAYSISRAERELGYRPRFGLEEGVRRTLAWYRERGYL